MSIIQFWKALFCFAIMPLYFGGSKKQSTASTSTVTDSRSIVTNTLDGGAIGESFDFASEMAKIFGGLGTSAVQSSATTAGRALDYGDSLFTTASDSVTKTAGSAITQYANLFDTAAGTLASQASNAQKGYENLFDQSLSAVTTGARDSQKQYADLFDKSLGFAENSQKSLVTAYDRAQSAQSAAMGQLQGAYADAKGTSDSQKQIMIGALVVAGLVVLGPVLAKA